MFSLVVFPELVHSIHLKSSHRSLLPTQVDPSNSRALRNSPFSPHCKNQTPAFLLKPTGFTVPAQRAPSLPTASAPWSKNQTSTALQLKRSTKRRRRKRNGGILRWRPTPSRPHPQLQRHRPTSWSRPARRSGRRRRKSERGRMRKERKRRRGSASRLIWTRQTRKRIGVRAACGVLRPIQIQNSLSKSLS